MLIFYYYINSRLACFLNKINSRLHADNNVQKGVIFFLINNLQDGSIIIQNEQDKPKKS